MKKQAHPTNQQCQCLEAQMCSTATARGAHQQPTSALAHKPPAQKDQQSHQQTHTCEHTMNQHQTGLPADTLNEVST